MIVIALACLGFVISFYTYYIEQKIRYNQSYKPVCDINERISCSKVMTSRYANIFFVSNSVLGMLYYLATAFVAYMGYSTILTIITILGVIASCGLAYILYFKIKSVCILCTSIYIINIALFFACI